ncbi:MAG: hypothetical protein R3257_01695 [bacterium]|nr:hypothetical protein [bacterium]
MAKGKYSLKERLKIDELYDTFMGLGQREQIMAAAGAAVVVLLLIILPISCASSKLGKMQKQITNHEKNVTKVLEKISVYNQAKGKLDRVEKSIRPKSQVQLTTRLESLATQSGIGGNIDSLKEKPGTPGEDFEEVVVAVRMSKLSLSQIIEFLYGVESQKDLSLKINRMQIRPRYDNRSKFDVNFEVSTLVSSQGG